MKTIALLGTLNTKAEELNYIKEKIVEKGHHVVLIDLSLSLWDSSSIKPDIDQKQIAEESGMKLEELTSLAQEDACTAVVKGATQVVSNLFQSGKLDGIIALGGTVGTSMGCAVMRSLPIGIPKLMVSTYVSDLRPYIGNKDIVFFPSITDMFGLNYISRRILAKASGAIVGMVEAETGSINVKKPLIGMSVRGDKAACVDNVKSLLEEKGFEVLCFHAVGQGVLFEELIREGLISGVMDLVPAEVNEYLFGGMFSAGPDRLEAAGERGIPQLV
ncbi:MAG: Tm-1-like ATP-binding domain-containing protein, partial [Thermodesulfobacteriota bacterium]